MVLRYAVFGLNGRYAPERRVKSTSFSSRKCARSGPCARKTESIDSSHSCVSVGSMSSNGDCGVIYRTLLGKHAPMHTLTCPVKMAGTLQRRCANCPGEFYQGILTALSSGFGFSRSSKDKPADLATFAV